MAHSLANGGPTGQRRVLESRRPLMPDDVSVIRMLILDAAACIAGILILLLPWGRWPGTTLAVRRADDALNRAKRKRTATA